MGVGLGPGARGRPPRAGVFRRRLGVPADRSADLAPASSVRRRPRDEDRTRAGGGPSRDLGAEGDGDRGSTGVGPDGSRVRRAGAWAVRPAAATGSSAPRGVPVRGVPSVRCRAETRRTDQVGGRPGRAHRSVGTASTCRGSSGAGALAGDRGVDDGEDREYRARRRRRGDRRRLPRQAHGVVGPRRRASGHRRTDARAPRSVPRSSQPGAPPARVRRTDTPNFGPRMAPRWIERHWLTRSSNRSRGPVRSLTGDRVSFLTKCGVVRGDLLGA